MKKFLKWTLIVLGALLVAVVLRSVWQLRDRHPGYEVDLDIKPPVTSSLKAGFAARTITPRIVDTWEDRDHNAKYEPEKGDIYHDNNHNGRFDAYWIAGFDNKRAANGVHDDVWTRVMVLDDGQTRLAVAALDAIGFGHDDVVDIRKMLPPDLGIDYLMVASTHDHESYDLLGIWGESMFRSGVNPEMMQHVKEQTVAAVAEAVRRLRPARLLVARDLHGAAPLVMDTREPIVMDEGLRILRAVDAVTDSTLGTFVEWGNHAETLWSDNLLITSDFWHYVREYLEKGLYNGDTLIHPGLGGTCVAVTGAIGGLMTTRGSQPVADPFRDTTYVEPAFDKARAEGARLAMLLFSALDHADTLPANSGIALRARTIDLPVQNTMFRLGALLGVLDFGMTGWFRKRSEVAAIRLGEMLSLLAVPGEIYPEIVNGGVEAPEGRDFDIQPLETPPLRETMPGEYKFVIGLANDEIGYIIPKSQWDVKAPYAYGKKKPQYGEENSLGPETAPLLYKALSEVIEGVKKP